MTCKLQDNKNSGPTCGFVFAATRDRHNILARRAARSLRQILPNALIDIYTDRELDDPVFDKDFILQRTWHRPKIEALRRSRFDRTIYLDNDIITIADPSDVFDVLDRFDLVGVHDNARNSTNALNVAGPSLPASFPSINSGVIGINRSMMIDQLLSDWEKRMAEFSHFTDQPSLRSLLWEQEINFGVLPIEYNLMAHANVRAMNHQSTVPRFLHVREVSKFGRSPGDPNTPLNIKEFYSMRYLSQLEMLAANDRSFKTADQKENRQTLRQKIRNWLLKFEQYNWRYLFELVQLRRSENAIRKKKKEVHGAIAD